MDSSEADLRMNGTIMAPLEFEEEEEMTSLMVETGGGMARHGMRKRRVHGFGNGAGGSKSDQGGGFAGLLRSKTAYVLRNALVLGVMGWLVFLFLTAMNQMVENEPTEETYARGSAHKSSFGGLNNPVNSAGFKEHNKHEAGDSQGFMVLPESNVGQKIVSVSTQNLMNHVGHYWHDPYRSPFSSPLYNVSDDELAKNQVDFEVLLNQTRDKFHGEWSLEDPYFIEFQKERPKPAFLDYPNDDCPVEEFPKKSWQIDEDYVGQFIDEARSLIARMKDGIYEEFGFTAYRNDGTRSTEDELKELKSFFQVVTEGYDVDDKNNAIDPKTKQKLLGIGHLRKNAWDALVKKLLHGMITTGNFFVVQVGDATAAGHGNNFIKSSIMQFHYIMEPVFDLLGMRLFSRNMAMKDTSVAYQGMGGADTIGETDLLWYASSYAGDTPGALDLLYKQAILGGERVPIILTDKPGNLAHESNQTAWIGNLHFAVCESKPNLNLCKDDIHDSVCWVDRSDVKPEVKQQTQVPPEKYPGHLYHLRHSRLLSMLVLHAMEAALDAWVDGIEDNDFPLKDEHWHINDMDVKVREAVRTFQEEDYSTPCEAMFGKELALLCHMELHAYTEWTPRVTPHESSLRSLIAGDMEVANFYIGEAYEGVDLLPFKWKPKENAVDVHAIGIVTSIPAREEDKFDPLAMYDDYDDDQGFGYNDDDGNSGRRNLNGSPERLQNRRVLLNPDLNVTAGLGWMMHNPISGYCDGSSQSTCSRSKDSNCLLAGHNDHRDSGLLGDDLSGWLILLIPSVREGIILARFDTKVPSGANTVTEGWSEVNNGAVAGSGSGQRQRDLAIGQDFVLDVAIGDSIKSYPMNEFQRMGIKVADDMVLHLLMSSKDDLDTDGGDTGSEGVNVQVAIRIRSNNKRSSSIMLTHIYYA